MCAFVVYMQIGHGGGLLKGWKEKYVNVKMSQVYLGRLQKTLPPKLSPSVVTPEYSLVENIVICARAGLPFAF